MKYLISLVLFISFQTSISAHDIHVSVMDVYEDNEGHLEFVIRIFYDDLLSAVGLVAGQELPENYSSSDELIIRYLRSHIQIKIDGVKYMLEHKESIASMPAVWTTLKLKNYKGGEFTKIQIENDVLIELFKDQTNMVNIDLNSIKKTYALDHKKKEVLFELKN